MFSFYFPFFDNGITIMYKILTKKAYSKKEKGLYPTRIPSCICYVLSVRCMFSFKRGNKLYKFLILKLYKRKDTTLFIPYRVSLVPSMQKRDNSEKGKMFVSLVSLQGYYPFCVPSLEGIRKAVIPSREGTQPAIIFCKGRDTTKD